MPMKNICVFCGSSLGQKPLYAACARSLGQEIVARQSRLVYGGGDVGLMGEIAREVLKRSGDSDSVRGFIPAGLVPREVSGEMRGETVVVQTMHERKLAMASSADCFIALPGGFGTMEEILEMITWQSLGYHTKPVGLLNVGGFYDHLLSFFDHCVSEGFIRQSSRDIVLVSDSPKELLDKLEAYVISHKPVIQEPAEADRNGNQQTSALDP